MAKRGITIETEHGTDDEGRLIYSAEEHAKLEAHAHRMSEDQYTDWDLASLQSRIVGADEAPKNGAPKQWTRAGWEAAAKKTHKMSEAEYQDWEAAPDEGRITD